MLVFTNSCRCIWSRPRTRCIVADDVINIVPWYRRYHDDRSGHTTPDTYWHSKGLGQAPFMACTGESRCRLVTELTKAHAVMISQRMLMPTTDFPNSHTLAAFRLPPYRTPQQKWIFVGNEPPAHRRVDQRYWKLFNATVTYKRASDVYYPYGRYRAVKSPNKQKLIETFSKKKKSVMWIVSNCKSSAARETYVAELAKYIDIDIFGKCAKKRCYRNRSAVPHMIPCNKISDYKFYLAFENSLCSEYATEKIWRSFSNDVIPVVYGIADYKDLLPPNSYIDIRGFQSPKHLAEHLKRVSVDRALYASYMAWRESYSIQQDMFDEAVCKLCEFLHRTRHDPPQTVDLESFWNKDNDCVEAKPFLEMVGVNTSQPPQNLQYLWSGEHDKIV